MSAFSPAVPPIPRPDRSEAMARFVPAALRRTPPVAKLWRTSRVVALGLLTAGFLPCVALRTRLRRVQTMQGQQCELAAELLRAYLPADEADVVADAAKKTSVGRALLGLSMLAAGVGLVLIVGWLGTHDFSPQAVYRAFVEPAFPSPLTARFGARHGLRHLAVTPDPRLLAGVVLLGVAYLLQIAQMNRQVLAMQQFALAFNATAGERVGPVEPPPLVWGVTAKALLIGGGLAYLGPVWALPMLVAWAAFGAFVKESALGFRVQLAERLQNLTGVETVVPRQDLCANPDCRSGLPADARFCPRCGTPLAGVVAGA